MSRHDLAQTRPLPRIAPGTSPFRIRGVTLEGFVEFFRERAKMEVRDILERLPDPEVRAYVMQRYVSSGWYDFLPYFQVANVIASACGMSASQLGAEHGSWQVRRDAKGINKLLMKVVSIETMVARTVPLFNRYYELGTLELLSSERGSMETAISGLPELLVPWFKSTVRASFTTLLEIAGARNIDVTYSPPEPFGITAGIPTVRFRTKRVWTRR